MTEPLLLSLEEFRSLLASLGGRRAAFVRAPDTGQLVATDPRLQELASAIATNTRDYDEHEAVFVEFGESTGACFGAFLHRTTRGQGAGGVRHWPYESLGGFVSDGLRLARGMGRKNALAGLWWGGGKGLIARQPDASRSHSSSAVYQEYGRFITSLRGCYVTAEDVGTRASDMAEIFRTTRFVTCVPTEVGGSGNPSPSTARGVVCAMRAALQHLGLDGLAQKRIAMQGIGNVGSSMIAQLLAEGVTHILATDISEARCTALRERFPGPPVEVRCVAPTDESVFQAPCDVLVPNALGGVLNPDTIAKIRARVVCGAANNQLLDDQRDDRLLAQRGIVFVPDFVANRMGIVQCANEQYGCLPGDPAIQRHFGDEWENAVAVVTRRVLERAQADGVTPTQAANSLADALGREPHPIFPYRTQAIIQSLVSDGWHRG